MQLYQSRPRSEKPITLHDSLLALGEGVQVVRSSSPDWLKLLNDITCLSHTHHTAHEVR